MPGRAIPVKHERTRLKLLFIRYNLSGDKRPIGPRKRPDAVVKQIIATRVAINAQFDEERKTLRNPNAKRLTH